ncbi:MAG TPA: PfkB family carbohydrate kinase [Actinospica sp.]|nr:PfkB family carbohydrate kinase [Actinospica sp.]
MVGPVGRDLVLLVDELPDTGTSAPVRWRQEVLGGKGANQAVAFARLGVPVSLVGVVGDDEVGDRVLAGAVADGIEVSCVVRRRGVPTGLIVEILDGEHRWRYLEDLPERAALDASDVHGAASVFSGASSAVVQLQQSAGSALVAAETAHEAGCRLVLDGVPAAEDRGKMLALADVLRADPREAELLTGRRLESTRDARLAADELLRQGPELVALAVEGGGNLFAWAGGRVFYPLDAVTALDTTGAGDALVAALVTALDRGLGPAQAGRWAVAAASLAVEHRGGRPQQLTLDALRARAERQPDGVEP